MRTFLSAVLFLSLATFGFAQEEMQEALMGQEEVREDIIGTWVEKYDSAISYKIYFYGDSIIFYESKVNSKEVIVAKFEYTLQKNYVVQCGYGKYKTNELHTDYSLKIHQYFPTDEDYGDCAPIYSISKTSLKINDLRSENLPLLSLVRIK